MKEPVDHILRILSDPRTCATCRHFVADGMKCLSPVGLADMAKALDLHPDYLAAVGTLEMRNRRGPCGPQGRRWMPFIRLLRPLSA